MLAAEHDTPDLPEHAAALLLETRAQLHSLVAERDALAHQNERLQHLLLLLQLKRRQFGTKSERLPGEQLLFAFEEIEATLAGNAAEAGKASPALRASQAWRRRAGCGRLPGHLPCIEVVLAPAATACPCCQGPLVEISSDSAERAIRPICLSRKNALFARGDDGGARWAAVASLVETGKLNGVDPQRYCTDVLMPWCWAAGDKD